MDTSRQTAYRQNLKGLIIDVAMQCFYSNGIRNVKMDDIAKKLQISKRTLYELYANKEELLLAGLKRDESAFEAQLQLFADKKAHNAMEVVMKFFQMQMKRLATINPCFFMDLHKYGNVVAYLETIHAERNIRSIKFFQAGIKEDIFLKNLDYELISKLCDEMIRGAMEKEIYRVYGLQHIFQNIITVFVRGFATKKGLEVVDKYLESGNLNGSLF
ncbi:TetR/AcrR family transcriptional regulator [Prevotella sp. A2931]|uniref:TetR/AcrR family transcriptional regulator n=1 Tax=Prevotella illustrans TaxID=2800387 RepID=A0ABS3M7E2_9BACT|nr:MULTISPECIES: TetR/AcrR family transcriptional regulator [Prevotella]MBO1364055.1 TetR/AcrR family transcriptional regulator [Prevotella illustrans]PTL25641.1 TetR family transcriptional regulator [Prevotella sp. oral taxon 820]